MRVARQAVIGMAALGLLVWAAGCGGGKENGKKSTDAGSASGSTLEKVKMDGVIKWGADPSGGAPFVYFDTKDSEKVIGFEMDIMEKFGKHMGVKTELVHGDWASLPDLLKSKRVDIVVNGWEITEERKETLSFSVPYYIYEQQLTVRAEDKDKYKTLADLKGKKVGTLKEAEANNVLRREGWTDEMIMQHEDSHTPYENLILKRTDAVLQESIIAEFYAGKDEKLHNVPETFSSGRYGILVRIEDKDLLEEVNRVLKVMIENGDLAEVYKKWGIWTEKQKELGIKEGAK